MAPPKGHLSKDWNSLPTGSSNMFASAGASIDVKKSKLREAAVKEANKGMRPDRAGQKVSAAATSEIVAQVCPSFHLFCLSFSLLTLNFDFISVLYRC